jgi:hypothetical protein
VAVVALARKLLIVLWRLAATGEMPAGLPAGAKRGSVKAILHLGLSIYGCRAPKL